MTAAARIDPIAAQLAPLISRVLVEEARKVQRARMVDADAEIMDAARAVGSALDALSRARFVANEEALAQQRLERSCANLKRIMKKHGRMP